MAALPYMQFYVADYLADTMHLTAEEHGAYMLLIFNYWQTGKPLLDDDRRLANIARVSSERWTDVKRSLTEYFVCVDGVLKHPRIEADLQFVADKQTKAVDAGKASAKSRLAKKQAKAGVRATNVPTNVPTERQPKGNHSESESESESEEKTISGKPDIAAQAIEYLNFVSGSNYQPVESNTKLIKARIAEGRTIDDIKAVIDRKNKEWPPGHKMREYMRPGTLFNASKFNDYYGQIGQPIPYDKNNNTQPPVEGI